MMKKEQKNTLQNIMMSQEKQKTAFDRKVKQKYKALTYNIGDEVLVYDSRKRGRKGGRLESDFNGPHIITGMCGKIVQVANTHGLALKQKIYMDHIKQFVRSNKSSAPRPESHVQSELA